MTKLPGRIMQNHMTSETVLYCNQVDSVKDYVTQKPYTRLYVGAECCAKLLPSFNQFENLFGVAQANDMAISLVTPIVLNHDLSTIEEIIRFFDSKGMVPEIIFNDFGVFHLVRERFPELELVMGRLLHKIKRDYYYYYNCPEDQRSKDYVAASNATNPFFLEWLREKEIHRIEADHTLQLLEFPKELKISLYYPYVYLSTSLDCPAASLTKDMSPHYEAECNHECQTYALHVHSDFKEKVLSVGNTSYFENKNLIRDRYKGIVDRFVFQPFVSH